MKKLSKNSTKQDVCKQLDEIFSPDIRIKIKGENATIIGCMAITTEGANYLLHNAILEKSYDEIDMKDLTFEIVE